jgi:hypothetical protein
MLHLEPTNQNDGSDDDNTPPTVWVVLTSDQDGDANVHVCATNLVALQLQLELTDEGLYHEIIVREQEVVR